MVHGLTGGSRTRPHRTSADAHHHERQLLGQSRASGREVACFARIWRQTGHRDVGRTKPSLERDAPRGQDRRRCREGLFVVTASVKSETTPGQDIRSWRNAQATLQRIQIMGCARGVRRRKRSLSLQPPLASAYRGRTGVVDVELPKL